MYSKKIYYLAIIISDISQKTMEIWRPLLVVGFKWLLRKKYEIMVKETVTICHRVTESLLSFEGELKKSELAIKL